MTIRADQLQPERPGQGSRGSYTTEFWEVWDSDDGTASGGHNPTGYCDPKLFKLVPGLPKWGNAHPIPGYGLVVDVYVSEVVANNSYIVAVTYRSWGLFTGGPRPGSRAFNETRWIELPVWNKFTDGTIIGWAKPEKRPAYPRMVAVRIEVRFVPGSAVSVVQNAQVANAGTLWFIDGLWYRLSDKCSTEYDGTTYTRAVYAFERDCEIQAIPPDVAGTAYGNDNAIPFLPALYLWSERPDLMSSANPPIVRAVPPPALTGGPPTYPALPGYP